jgi:hypothetical protein
VFPLRVGEDDIMYDGKARLELCNLQSDSSLIYVRRDVSAAGGGGRYYVRRQGKA